MALLRAPGEKAMTAPSKIRIFAVCAAMLCAAHFTAPAAACENGRCPTGSAEAKPIKLKDHMRKPVASSATRAVKRADGEQKKVAIKRRAKPRGEPRTEPATKSATKPEAPLQQTISPAAAQAFASYQVARVRVVSPELVEEARLLADLVAKGSPLADDTSMVGADDVKVVDSSEVNDIDLKADAAPAVSFEALSRDLAGSRTLPSESVSAAVSKETGESLLQRALVIIGSAFAGLTTLVRIVLG
jgi:hypothetical protein